MGAPRWEGEVRVESLAAGGAGVARLPDGRVMLVERVIEGELIRVAVEADARGKGQHRLLAIVEPSIDRRELGCPLARACGGCDWMHIAADGQAARHARIVADLIAHACGARPQVLAHPAPSATGYRTRARFLVKCERNAARIGYRGAGSHALVQVDRCLVLDDALLAAATTVASWLRGTHAEGEIGVAFGVRGGVRLPVIEVSLTSDPAPGFFTRLDAACSGDGPFAGARVLLRGATRPLSFADPRPVQVGFDGAPLVLAAGGFAQPSDAGAALLATRVRALAGPEGARVLELFAGSGTLSVALAPGARSFAAVEQDAEAIACARENLATRALAGKLRVADAEATPVPAGVDLVVLDPPRAGAPRAVAAIVAARPRRVLYVSCDPPTLARDLGALVRGGYRVDQVETLELFPQTSHVETVVSLVRGGGPKAAP